MAAAPVLGRLRSGRQRGRVRSAGDADRRAARRAGRRRGVPLERSLPQRSYTEEAEFARERDQVLFPGWFCVGRADGLTEPG